MLPSGKEISAENHLPLFLVKSRGNLNEIVANFR
jgi:hypothetical protein